MSIDRRGFLGAGFAAAGAAFAGKRLTADETLEQVVEKIEPPNIKIERVATPPQGAFRILRLQSISRCIRERDTEAGDFFTHKWLEAGDFFTHKWLEADYLNLGNRLNCDGYQCAGAKAMRLDLHSKSGEPIEIYTDPHCYGFKQIMADAEGRASERMIGCLWGPVYLLKLKGGPTIEMFCSSMSQRPLMQDFARISSRERFILCSKKVQTKKFSWYIPILERYKAQS